MKRLLVLYGTTEGHTRKVAEFLAERLREAAQEVDLIDSASPAAEQTPPIYAGALILGSVHHDRHQAALTHFVKANIGWLNAMPTAFFSVNLAMLHPEPETRLEAQKNMEEFLAETGLKPRVARLVAGALKNAQYDFFKRALVRYLEKPGALKADPATDVEYTNWSDVGDFVNEFIAMIEN